MAVALTWLPALALIAVALAMNAVRLLMILVGLSWLMSDMFWVVAIAGLFAIVAPFAMFRALVERDLRG